MFHSTVQNLEINDNLETVLNLLQDVAPGNEKIKTEIGKISKNRNTFIQQLQTLWNNRTQPMYTEMEIRQLCSQYYSEELQNSIVDLQQGRPTCRMDPKNWIIKSDDKWLGWNAEMSEYFAEPILFEGNLNFSKNFDNLIVSNRESGSINLIWTLRKFLE